MIHYSLGNSYYFTLVGSTVVNEEFIERMRAEMRRIVEAEIPITKRSINTDDAIALFHKHHMYDKGKAVFATAEFPKVNIYSIEGFDDYFYGFMASHTGFIREFDLKLYDEGFVLMLPDRKDPGRYLLLSPWTKFFRCRRSPRSGETRWMCPRWES